MSDREKSVVAEIGKNPKISKTKLIELTGIPKTSLERIISSLKEKGLLERVGSDKNGYWKIK